MIRFELITCDMRGDLAQIIGQQTLHIDIEIIAELELINDHTL